MSVKLNCLKNRIPSKEFMKFWNLSSENITPDDKNNGRDANERKSSEIIGQIDLRLLVYFLLQKKKL